VQLRWKLPNAFLKPLNLFLKANLINKFFPSIQIIIISINRTRQSRETNRRIQRHQTTSGHTMEENGGSSTANHKNLVHDNSHNKLDIGFISRRKTFAVWK
jgi:hypothetical protein